eukprot:m.64338 g.64338  ORF g.64338 m.64338 type:complete len:90 (-) comp12007_c1_seq1:580-849(-)
MVKAASDTGVGKATAASKVGNARQRTTTRKAGTSSAQAAGTPESKAGTWNFYSDDAPGLKVGPVFVIGSSLAFIAVVFMLHMWSKFTKA